MPLPQVPPIYNNQIVSQGLARLTSSFITQPNCRAWLSVLLQPWQDLEDATFAVLNARILATATMYQLPASNIAFDTLGSIVGIQSRGGLSDYDLKALIYLKVAVNRSTGRVSDWSTFARILTPFCDVVPVLINDQAGIYFGCWNLFDTPTQNPANTIASVLSKAVPNGVAAELAYTTWRDGNDFSCSSVYSSGAGEAGFSSVYETAIGGLMCAAAKLQ